MTVFVSYLLLPKIVSTCLYLLFLEGGQSMNHKPILSSVEFTLYKSLNSMSTSQDLLVKVHFCFSFTILIPFYHFILCALFNYTIVDFRSIYCLLDILMPCQFVQYLKNCLRLTNMYCIKFT